MSGAPDGRDDATLAAGALAGDDRAFTHLMRRHKEAVYRFVRRYAGDPDEAYDLTQETFVSAWAALRSFDTTKPMQAWLRRIALNKCRDWSRRRAVRSFFFRARPLEAARAAPVDAIQHEDPSLALLDQAIAALPQNLKEPLVLTALEGLSHKDAAALLNISIKAVESRVARARKKLAHSLAATTIPPEG